MLCVCVCALIIWRLNGICGPSRAISLVNSAAVHDVVFLLGQTFDEPTLQNAIDALPNRILDIEGRPHVQV